jgi:hypothetical protein
MVAAEAMPHQASADRIIAGEFMGYLAIGIGALNMTPELLLYRRNSSNS